MKQIITLVCCVILLNSCGALYTPSQQPTTFLEKEDGTALSGNIGHNGSTAIIGVSATKAIKKNLSLNANGHLGLIPYYYAPGNPFTNSKKSNSLNVNLGWNTRKITNYPIQLWLGTQYGNATDANYLSFYSPNIITKDVQAGSVDSILFEKSIVSYLGTRIGASVVVYSTYENDAEKKKSRKRNFDITHTASLSPTKFNIKNYDTIKSQTNVFVGSSTAIRYYTNKWMLSYNQEINLGGKNLFDDLHDRKVSKKYEMQNFPLIVPYLSFTYFLK
jgi:hypothetical protein